MPNHIRNRVTFYGDQQVINELVKKYSTFYPSKPSKSYDGSTVYKGSTAYEYGWLDEKTNVFSRRGLPDVIGVPEGFTVDMTDEWTRFPDFDKVKPCPKSIKDVGDHVSAKIVDHVKNKYRVPHSGNPIVALLESHNRMNTAEINEDEIPQFERACKAYEETGYIYWYDWQCENWGTKWNAYECNKLSDNQFEFDTAWSGVPEMIKEISSQFPYVKIEYKYSDEDTGHNCGVYEFEGGEEKLVHIPDGGSIEAYELSFELRPGSAEYYELVDGEYVYKEDDEEL